MWWKAPFPTNLIAICAVSLVGHFLFDVSQARDMDIDCHQRHRDVPYMRCGTQCHSDRDCGPGILECVCDGECGRSCVDTNQECEQIEPLVHGRVDINPENKFGAIAQYLCNEGYSIVGLPARICQGDKTWKGNPPRCEPDHQLGRDEKISCGQPPRANNAHPINGRNKTSFSVGANLRYRCSSGFTPSQKSVDRAWCVRGGTWVGPDMDCITTGCNLPADIPHGIVKMQTQNIPGGKMRYECRRGYFLVGSAVRTCQRDGSWDGNEPSCLPGKMVTCGPPPQVEHADHDGVPGQFRYKIGTYLEYTCEHGYFRDGSRRAVCSGPSGQWVGPNMSCNARTCGPPSSIENGWIIPGNRFTFPARVRYNCLEGYELKGQYFRECQANGEWSTDMPSCEPIQCSELDPPLNGIKHGEGTKFGTEIEISCSNSYKVVGSAVRTCQADRTWSGQRATCEEVDCGVPEPLWNGHLQGHATTVGKRFYFRCNLRNELSGNDLFTTCQADGRWSVPTPLCHGECRVPSIPNVSTGSTVGLYLNHGTMLETHCLNGLTSQDIRPMTCINGTWSHITRCVPSPCSSSPPQLLDGHRVFFSVAHGAKARYFCNAGFRLMTKKAQYLRCEFGKWVGKRPICEEHYCPHPGTLENGSIYKVGVKGRFPFMDYITTIRHGVRLTYECERDYRLQGARGAACINGLWSPQEKPQCKRSRHPILNKMWAPTQERFRRRQYYRR